MIGGTGGGLKVRSSMGGGPNNLGTLLEGVDRDQSIRSFLEVHQGPLTLITLLEVHQGPKTITIVRVPIGRCLQPLRLFQNLEKTSQKVVVKGQEQGVNHVQEALALDCCQIQKTMSLSEVILNVVTIAVAAESLEVGAAPENSVKKRRSGNLVSDQ